MIYTFSSFGFDQIFIFSLLHHVKDLLCEGYGVGPLFRGRHSCLASPASCDNYLSIIIYIYLNKLVCSTRRTNLLLLRYHSRKEVFQPHLPVRLPCYDLAPITSVTLGRSLRLRTSGTPGFHGLTGGVYKARERIHRAVADARLLANPASWSRVADSSPN